MFERFTTAAREIVEGAVATGQALEADRVGSEHLLVALSREAGPTGQVLSAVGLDQAYVLDRIRTRQGSLLDERDADALGAIGVDLARVRDSIEATFGRGALDPSQDRGRRKRRRHVPFGPDAKKTLELALREALRLKDRHIGPEHMLLGIIRDGHSTAATIIGDQISLTELRTLLLERLDRAA